MEVGETKTLLRQQALTKNGAMTKKSLVENKQYHWNMMKWIKMELNYTFLVAIGRIKNCLTCNIMN